MLSMGLIITQNVSIPPLLLVPLMKKNAAPIEAEPLAEKRTF